MSGIEDLGSSLPSYPTLPSPPKSDQHFQNELSPFDSHPVDREYTISPPGNVNQVPIMHYSGPSKQHHHHHHSVQSCAQTGMRPDGYFRTISPISPLLGDNLPQSATTTTNTSSPIYATVKKPIVTDPFTLQHSKMHVDSTHQHTVLGSPFTATTDPASPSVTPLIPVANSSTDSSTFALRIQYLEMLCSKLQHEKTELEESFGRQRKSFMNQMAQSDAQISSCQQTIEKYNKEIQRLNGQLKVKDEQLQDITIAASFTEATIRERFDADRVKYEEEIASLRKIVSVQSQDTNQAMQLERERWQAENASLRTELDQLRRQGLAAIDTSSSFEFGKSPSPVGEDKNLEHSMMKAAEDSKLLREVVLPLEKEIQSLKERLSETQSKLAEVETEKEEFINLSLTNTISELDSSRDMRSPIPSDVRELQNHLKLARSACSDLEMHTAQLNMQKNIMQEEIKSLSEQLTKVTTNYEVEKLNNIDLRETWRLANQHFVVSQDKLKQEIYRLHQKLERGEVVSPLRDIHIEDMPAPTIIKRSPRKMEEESATHTHRRSWSTDELSDVCLETPNLQHMKSVSWNSLHKPGFTSDETEALSKKAEALEEELLKVRSELKRQSDICANYERQLPRVQEQLMKDLTDKEAIIDKIKADNEKLEIHVMCQRQQHETFCRQMDDLKEEMKTRIETFQSYERDLKNQIRVIKDKFTEIKQDAQKEIVRMSEDRRDIYQQLETTREEYKCLKEVQSNDMAEYQAKVAGLSQDLQEYDTKLSSTVSQLNNAKDQLKQVREMLSIERTNKERLSSQYESAKGRLDELAQLLPQLDAEKQAKEEALAAKLSTERKSKDFINNQRDLIEKISKDKEKAETQVQELQRQVASLKHKLNYTEETQKDFVELSQSLQMKLAVIEEEKQRSQEQESLSTPTT